jgi:putative Ca2+/H+ antiporter (TMEM165/GDT1 family)
MDTFNFLVAMLLILLAMQYSQNWIVLGIIAVIFLSTRSMATTFATIIGTAMIWFFSGSGGNLNSFLPFIVLGFIIIALVMGVGGKERAPEYYTPQGGGMFGGI